MINREILKKAAKLSMLKLTEAEREKTLAEMSQILAHFNELQKVNTDGVEPLHTPVDMSNLWRPDQMDIKETKEELMSSLKDTMEGQIKVPQVV